MKLTDIIVDTIKVKCTSEQFNTIHNLLNQLDCKWDGLTHFDMLNLSIKGICIYPHKFPNCVTVFSTEHGYEEKNVHGYTFDEFVDKFKFFCIFPSNKIIFTKLELEKFSKFYNENINSYEFEEAFTEFFKTN